MTKEQWNAFVAARWAACIEAGKQQAIRDELQRIATAPPNGDK